jgi:hypothetical protein
MINHLNDKSLLKNIFLEISKVQKSEEKVIALRKINVKGNFFQTKVRASDST